LLQLLEKAPRPRVEDLEHHLCHAASAFYASPFDEALILTLDEQGDGRTGFVAVGEGTRLRPVASVRFPHSIGWLFTQITGLIGFAPHGDEHKTQWLGLRCEPTFLDLFLKMIRPQSGDLPRLDMRYFTRSGSGRLAFSSRFYGELGLDPKQFVKKRREGSGTPIPAALKAQLAASLQQASATAIAEIAENFRHSTRTKNLCVAGGVFLNSVTGFEKLFIQPAAGNEGTALGAAWLAWHRYPAHGRMEPIEHLYWGPSYSNQEIKQVLDNCKLLYRWHDGEEQRLTEVVRLLQSGKIVAWFHGAAEFGPRALGNRSLLASPWAPYVQENLNEFVKHREFFRPFALAVPAERAAEYFDYTPAARFMATLGKVRERARSLLDGFLLAGDRVRLHVVERHVNPSFHDLLERFGESSPAPLLVNTSFNLFGEPLVITPRDAVRSCFCSGIDALAIGNFTLVK
jgi:carbamoyltransferase